MDLISSFTNLFSYNKPPVSTLVNLTKPNTLLLTHNENINRGSNFAQFSTAYKVASFAIYALFLLPAVLLDKIPPIRKLVLSRLSRPETAQEKIPNPITQSLFNWCFRPEHAKGSSVSIDLIKPLSSDHS